MKGFVTTAARSGSPCGESEFPVSRDPKGVLPNEKTCDFLVTSVASCFSAVPISIWFSKTANRVQGSFASA